MAVYALEAKVAAEQGGAFYGRGKLGSGGILASHAEGPGDWPGRSGAPVQGGSDITRETQIGWRNFSRPLACARG